MGALCPKESCLAAPIGAKLNRPKFLTRPLLNFLSVATNTVNGTVCILLRPPRTAVASAQHITESELSKCEAIGYYRRNHWIYNMCSER